VFLQPTGHAAQELVAGVVAEAVVDVLEAVEIEEQQGDLGTVALGTGDGAAQAVAKQGAVGEAGEGVVVGQVGEAFFGLAPLGDVAGDGDDAGHPLVVGVGFDAGAGLQPQGAAVLPLRLVADPVLTVRFGQLGEQAFAVAAGVEAVEDLVQGEADEGVGRASEDAFGGGGGVAAAPVLVVHGDKIGGVAGEDLRLVRFAVGVFGEDEQDADARQAMEVQLRLDPHGVVPTLVAQARGVAFAHARLGDEAVEGGQGIPLHHFLPLTRICSP